MRPAAGNQERPVQRRMRRPAVRHTWSRAPVVRVHRVHTPSSGLLQQPADGTCSPQRCNGGRAGGPESAVAPSSMVLTWSKGPRADDLSLVLEEARLRFLYMIDSLA